MSSPPWAATAAPSLDDAAAGVDHLDRLPDPVILLILNRVGDVKALGRCCLVSRRLRLLAPLADDVLVRVDCVISDDPSSAPSPKPRSGGVFYHLLAGFARPLHALGQILSPKRSLSPTSAPEVSHHSPTEVLKNFREIRRLRIELPAGELGVDDGVLLKWKATFGSSLDSCAIIAASSVLSSDKPDLLCSSSTTATDDTMPESFNSNGSLKLRVVWTISSLIAASARHYLLHPIIADHHETLQSLDLTDADGQGVLTMDRMQLQEVQVRPGSPSGSSQRTLIPALTMRLWYAPHLDLPGGVVLKGATLVAIRPSEERMSDVPGGGGMSDGCWISNVFEEPYQTAVQMLLKRRSYCLEMNSF